jgi:hypothetical protein
VVGGLEASANPGSQIRTAMRFMCVKLLGRFDHTLTL